jgi:hypothetical protein
MKSGKFIYCMIILTLIIITPVTAEEPPPAISQVFDANLPIQPVAFVPETQFEFQPVLDGTQITHDFIIKNMGGGILQIRDVITNCGCATAEFPREIAPGGEGKITIKGDTTGYGGISFDRDILVSTNDPKKSVFHIYLYGKIEEFAYVEPKIAVLRGTAGQPIQSVITITPRKEYPFTLLEVSIDDVLKDKVKFSREQRDGKYIVTIDNIQKTSGKYVGKLYMKTDNKLKPVMKMYIKGTIN